MGYEIGQKVKFINQDLEGEIKSILSNGRIMVTCVDGFDYDVSLGDILVVNDDNSHLYKVDQEAVKDQVTPKQTRSKPQKSILSPYQNRAKYQMERTLEIDLHLEELVEFPGKLDDWQKLHTQMQHVKNCLNEAMDQSIVRIVFIHGVGTGVLKTELKNHLANFSNMIVSDADFREYGMGATQVTIKY